ncbi:MAG: endonuclease III domain-containing protein [Chloroflexota bacterium]
MSTVSEMLALEREQKGQWLARVYELLRTAYGKPEREERDDPIGELVGTILSQHTSDINSRRAYVNLIATFGSWEAVREAGIADIATAVRSAGLASVKAPRIKAVLQTIAARYGRLSLDHLADLPLAEAKKQLTSLPGIGPKTAACTLLFSFGLPAFPVDTHIYRVTRRLGILPERLGADAAHDYLEPLVPADEVYPLHVLLIWHGRRICHAQRPLCPECALLHDCNFGRRAVGLD